MKAGRFVCVALPIALTIAAIIAMMVATLSGIAHNNLYMFSVDLSELSIDPSTLENIVDNLDISPSRRDVEKRDITAADLGLGSSYDITLWSYCENKDNGERDCIKGQFDWATKRLKKDFLDDLGSAAGVKIELPEEIQKALDIFSSGIKYTEIAFIASLVALGLELLVGIFSNCTRVVSCLTWLIALAALLVTGVAAGLATAMSAVVVGAIEGSDDLYGVQGTINTNFLAAIWIGAAFAIAASLFWLFTVCCCKPDHRSKDKRRGSTDGEKLLPTGSYQPLGDYEIGGAGYKNQYEPSSYQPSSYAPSFNRPPSHHGRTDMGFEPFSHRA